MPEVSVVDIDDRLSVFDSRTQTVLALNEAASDVWRLSDGEHTGDDIVRLLAQAYSVHPEAIRADVYSAIDVFHNAQLLVTARGQGGSAEPLLPSGPRRS